MSTTCIHHTSNHQLRSEMLIRFVLYGLVEIYDILRNLLQMNRYIFWVYNIHNSDKPVHNT